jgi:hypothetical protein
LAKTVTPGSRPFKAAVELRDGVAGAHCIHELWMRNEPPMNVQALLSLAYEVAARFKREGRGRSNIYLVLLDYSDSSSGPHGVYVGATGYSPSARFDQHKAGIRAAGSVLKRGIEVLTGPVLHLQRIPRAQAEEIEEGLAEALRAAGLKVQGGH